MSSNSEEQGSVFDLRDYERQRFGEIYSALLSKRLELQKGRGISEAEEYLSLLSVSAGYLKHYCSGDNREQAAFVEEQARKMSRGVSENLDNFSQVRVQEFYDIVEGLRHDVGLDLPQETRTDPETVGASQL